MSNHMIPLKDDPSFIKDLSSGAIINTNDSYYNQILAKRSQAKQSEEICTKMKQLENELTTIKNLLQQILDGRKDG